MFDITIGEYLIEVANEPPPTTTGGQLADTFGLDPIGTYEETCFLSVAREGDGVLLTVLQSHCQCFSPGALLILETDTLFFGAGERLLCYDLKNVRRLWEDQTDGGFWQWHRCGEYVVMQAELGLAVWTIGGNKLWSTFMEPPHGVSVKEGRLFIDAFGLNGQMPFKGEVSVASGPGK